jgi:DNA-directed RNA polymerase specialized sigma24 family protein
LYTSAAAAKLPDPNDVGDGTSDRSLLRRYSTGSEAAAALVYNRYAARLRALVRSKLSSPLTRRLDPDDIVQSVFRRFFHSVSQGNYSVPEGDDLWDLLLVITLNKVRTEEAFHRAGKRDVRLTAGGMWTGAALTALARHDSAVYFRLAVDEALERLPDLHREVVELRMAGHEVADIARQTGRSKRTVERFLQEARRQLSTLLDGTA